MKAKEFEIKKRDPNWRAMQDIRRSGAGGQHKDKKKAAKQGQVKHKGQMAEGIEELEARRDELERVLKKAREITSAIKYEDTVNEIVTQIEELAESIGIADELKYPLGDVYEAQKQLQSAVYGLDEVFGEALRNVSWQIDDMEEEEYDRNN